MDALSPLESTLIGIGSALVGTVIGWALAHYTAKSVAEEARKWEESQAIRARQEVAAEALRASVIEAQAEAPGGDLEFSEAGALIEKTHLELRRGWTGASLLRDESIDRAFYALDMTLFMAGTDVRHGAYMRRDRRPTRANFWPISVAFIDLRKALDAYLRRESSVELSYPTSKELLSIAHEGRKTEGLAIEGINDYLIEHEIGA